MVTAELVSDQPGCLLVALRVRHEHADQCARQLATLNERLAAFAGFSSLDIIRREGGLGTDFYCLARFRSVEALNEWRESPDRKELLGGIEALAISDISRQQAAGSTIWFDPIRSMPTSPRPPKFWKRWATSMLAVYPALILLVTLLKPVTAPLPEPLSLLVVALILTGLTTAFIVPWLNQLLHGWLVSRS